MTPSDAPRHIVPGDQPMLVGIGSVNGDDQVGWIVAKRLQDRCGNRVHVRTTSVPLDLLNWIDESTELHIVDACDGDEPTSTGHLHRWDWNQDADHRKTFVLRRTGTHDFDVVSVLELAHRLGRLPRSVTIWGIQGECWTDTGSLSAAVATAMTALVDFLATELAKSRTIADPLAADAD